MIKSSSTSKLLVLIFILYSHTLASQEPFFNSEPGSNWLSTDLHIHTVFSDGAVWPSIRVEEALREGLDLIAMTDHLEYQPHADDIPHPDRNRSYFIAKSVIQQGNELLVINGSEITREMPPGHINAVFIKDANALLHKDSLSGIKAANKQNAFVFWNHPNWDSQRKNGIARLETFHVYLIENKLLHGIEVVNEFTFSEEALQIALDNNLTILGTSDIHGLSDWEHKIAKGGHRPMTFVHVVDKSVASFKNALFKGETFVWHQDLLIGKEKHLKNLISQNIIFGEPKYAKDKAIMQVQIINKSATPFQMEYTGEYTFHKRGSVFIIPSKSELTLFIKTKIKKGSVALPFRILNAIIAPNKLLEYTFVVK